MVTQPPVATSARDCRCGFAKTGKCNVTVLPTGGLSECNLRQQIQAQEYSKLLDSYTYLDLDAIKWDTQWEAFIAPCRCKTCKVCHTMIKKGKPAPEGCVYGGPYIKEPLDKTGMGW